MPLYSNGVLIPENTANAFTFNGVNVTDVFMNGVQVWNQSLFSATWSGNALSGGRGIGTSGNLFRAISATSGAWITANQNGTFSNTFSNGAASYLGQFMLAAGGSQGTSSNSFKIGATNKNGNQWSAEIFYTIGTGFHLAGGAGTVAVDGGMSNVYWLEVGTDGRIRVAYYSTASYSQWISLT